LITVVGAFAEAFGNPVAPALVLCLAILLPRPGPLRAACATLGGAMAVPGLLAAASASEAGLILVGSVAAVLLYAEVMLHLVLPCCRFAWRCATTSWELLGLVLAFLLRPGRQPSAEPGATGQAAGPDGGDPATPKEPPP
jgi:hypothetical protein